MPLISDATLAPGQTTVADWLQLIRAEYLEIPGLRLTGGSVQHLWNLDPVTCDALLAALLGARFLKRNAKRCVYARG